ncbi:MAG: PD-(D/E)XK nuclease family protein [Lachnospirales bacterium]
MGYKIFYSDSNTDNCQICNKLLKSKKYLLQGKPDLILKHFQCNNYVVVELKSGSSLKDKKPKSNDLMQLVTYFLITEDLFKKPKFGKLIYSDCMYIVKNTWYLRFKLKRIISQMNRMLVTGSGKCEPNFNHCKNCLCKAVCKFYK